MFRVSYVSGKFEDRRHKDFASFASAQYYFLAKFREERPGLRLSVLPSEIVDRIELERESDGPAPEEVSE